MDDLLGMTRAAEYLRVPRQTVYRISRDGRLPGVLIDGRLFFRPEDLDKVEIRGHGVKSSKNDASGSPRRNPGKG